MTDRSIPTTKNLTGSASVSRRRQAIRLLRAAAIGASLLFLSGLALTATVVSLIVATSVLILFSPILVPAGILLLFATAGFVVSSSCSLAALFWVCSGVPGRHRPRAEPLPSARRRIADKARDMKKRAEEYVQHKAQEVGPQGS
ncbi:oleosin Ara h 15.0101-like [Diospyros lotus]|uniref:oleosin Ara h 15.0101-like n=1 Tax=Diospyros lotus TaxID=55363 RepID=UPI0022522642|nr:oleosin Ara h 15.0101-like [Diospyros lotus]